MAGAVSVTVLWDTQENDAVPENPWSSVAVRVTDDEPAVVGVPEIVPVVGSIVRPAGRPVADHDAMVAVDEVSVAVGVTGVMAVPETLDRSPGFTTVTTLVTVQVTSVDAENPAPSDTVTVTA